MWYLTEKIFLSAKRKKGNSKNLVILIREYAFTLYKPSANEPMDHKTWQIKG